MPAFVKTAADEEKWAEAKRQAIAVRARESGKGEKHRRKTKWPLANWLFWQKKGAGKSRFSFVDRLRIVPEKAEPEHNSTSIGQSGVDGKWYGWSHRAYHGFGTRQAAKRFARSVS